MSDSCGCWPKSSAIPYEISMKTVSSVLSRKSLYIIPLGARKREQGMARPIKAITASEDVRAELERRTKASTSTHRDLFRAEIILLRLDGLKIEDVAGRLDTSMPTVSIWSSRFERFGLDGLKDKTGRGRKPSIPAAKIERVITGATRPPEGLSRWSVRSMGRHAGVSHSTVQRIWSKNDLKPHVTRIL